MVWAAVKLYTIANARVGKPHEGHREAKDIVKHIYTVDGGDMIH